MKLNSCFFLASLVLVAACGGNSGSSGPDFFSDEGKRELVAQYRNSEDPDAKTPVVRSKALYAKYANVFKTACLANINDLTAAPAIFANSGMRPVAVAQYKPSIAGYFDNTPANLSTMGKVYAELSVSMKRADGKIPYITGFSGSSSTSKAVFTDGTAVAEVNIGKSINNTCSVRVKTPDDDPLVAQLGRVVNETGLASGPPRNTGILGLGYMIESKPKVLISIGRGRRSDQSPTYLNAVIFNRR